MSNLATGYLRSHQVLEAGTPRLGSCFRSEIFLPKLNLRLSCPLRRTELTVGSEHLDLGESELVLVCSRLHSWILRNQEISL